MFALRPSSLFALLFAVVPCFATAAQDINAKGTLVAHPQFGRGVVLSCTQGSNARVTVEFKGLGKKTLVLEYARLKRL